MKGRETLLVVEVHLKKEGAYIDTVYATMNPAKMSGFVSGKWYRRYRVDFKWDVSKQLIEIYCNHIDPWENFHIAICMKELRNSLTEKYMEYAKRATEV